MVVLPPKNGQQMNDAMHCRINWSNMNLNNNLYFELPNLFCFHSTNSNIMISSAKILFIYDIIIFQFINIQFIKDFISSMNLICITHVECLFALDILLPFTNKLR